MTARQIQRQSEFNFHKRYVDYVKRCGGLICQYKFIDDWEPVGQHVLGRCVALGLLTYDEAGNVILPPPAPKPLKSVEAAIKIEPL